MKTQWNRATMFAHAKANEGWKIARMELGARYDLGAALGPVIHAALRIHAYTRHGVSDMHTIVRPATAAFHGLPKLRPIPYTPRALSSLLFLLSFTSLLRPPSPSPPPSLRATCIPLPPSFFFSYSPLSFSRSVLPTVLLARESARESRPSALSYRNLHILSPFFSFSHFLLAANVRHLARSHRHHRISFDREILRDYERIASFSRGFRLPFSAPIEDRFNLSRAALYHYIYIYIYTHGKR